MSKIKCLHSIPSDIFTEIVEELGGSNTIDFLEVWRTWSHCQFGGDELVARENSFLLTRLRSDYHGSWSAHTHGHQLIVSTVRVLASHVFIGQADGTVQHFMVTQPEYCQQLNIIDGSVREIEIWFKENMLIVSGDHGLHFIDINTMTIKRSFGEVQSQENKHVSCFGPHFSFCLPDDHSISVNKWCGSNFQIICRVTPVCKPIQWKLWSDKMIVLEVQGEISIYSLGVKPELVYKTESNMMIMYKNPCYMFRDVIFCSTSAAVGLIVRTSYWLLGWQLHQGHKKLHRALDQDKIHPQDEVWCVALRRNIVVCGTETGCLIMFSNDKAEKVNENDTFDHDLQMKRGHSVVQLEFDCYKVPVFKKQVSNRPILSVDVGFSDDKTFIFYRTDIQSMSCLTLSRKA